MHSSLDEVLITMRTWLSFVPWENSLKYIKNITKVKVMYKFSSDTLGVYCQLYNLDHDWIFGDDVPF